MLFLLTLTWNRCDLLSRLKNSIVPAIENMDYTWFIKDNNSEDDTHKIASQWGDKIQCIKYKDNLQNFSEGMNYLFNIANPKDDDLILLLNNDIVFNDTTSISKMISLLKPDVGVVGAKLLYTNTDKLQHAGVIFPNKLPINYRAGHKVDDNASKNRYFQAVTGAVMLLRAGLYRSLTNKSNQIGLDPEYIYGFEDVDLCMHSLYNMNKKVVYCGETNIFHDESASLKKNALHRLFLSKNAAHFVDKWSNKYWADLKDYQSDPNFNIIK